MEKLIKLKERILQLKSEHQIFILIFIFICIYNIPLPYYKLALVNTILIVIVATLIITLSIKYLIKNLLVNLYNKLNKYNFYKKLVPNTTGIMGFITLLMLIFPSLTPTYETHEKYNGVVENVVYITYNHDCENCKKSYDSVRRAAFIYNTNHPLSKIEIVNLKDNTRLARDLSSSLEHYGTITKATKKELYEYGYSLADSEGNPVANTPDFIYDKIIELNKTK